MLPAAASAQSIEGVWKISEVVIGGGPDQGRHTADVQPSLIIYTNSHYSTMIVRTWEPRPMLSNNPTNEERGRVFSPFTANSGTYVVRGKTITKTPLVAKNPAVMTDFTIINEIEWDGDTFWLISDARDGNWQNRTRYERIGD
jgi:hypothetical protein